MRRMARAVVSTVMVISAILAVAMSMASASAAVRPASVQAADTCYSSPITGTEFLFVVQCGATVNVLYHGPDAFGHVEVWQKTTHQSKNSASDTWWSGGDSTSISVTWSHPTCAQFWEKYLGQYVNLGGIWCTT